MFSGWNGLSGALCKALRVLFVDKHYINALFKVFFFPSELFFAVLVLELLKSRVFTAQTFLNCLG